VFCTKLPANSDLTDDIDSEGMHHNVNVVNLDDRNLKVNKVDPTADTKHFFKAAPHQCHYIKPHSICILCEYMFNYFSNSLPRIADFLSREAKGHRKQVLIADTTTLQRHMAYLHPVCSIFFCQIFIHCCVAQKTYHKWCRENNFESMLPEDAKARRAEIARTITQTVVDDHFSIQKPRTNQNPTVTCFSRRQQSSGLLKRIRYVSSIDLETLIDSFKSQSKHLIIQHLST
jgi:hypothetical protein